MPEQMHIPQDDQRISLGIKEAFAVALPLFVAIGTCYVIGYWSLFQVNALEYVSLTDVAKLAIYPLAATTFFLLSFYLLDDTLERSTQKWRPERKPDARPNGAIHRNSTIIISLAAMAVSYLFLPQPTNWMLIAGMSFVLMLPIAWEDRVVRAIPDRLTRYVAVILPIPCMLIAFYTGRANAVDVLTGKAPRLIDVDHSELAPATITSPSAYLGTLGNTHFIYEVSADRVILITADPNHVIAYRPKRPPRGFLVDADILVRSDQTTSAQPQAPEPRKDRPAETRPQKK